MKLLLRGLHVIVPRYSHFYTLAIKDTQKMSLMAGSVSLMAGATKSVDLGLKTHVQDIRLTRAFVFWNATVKGRFINYQTL